MAHRRHSTFWVSRTFSGKTLGGEFTIHRRTARKKFQAKLVEIKETLSRRCHDDLAKVGEWLQSVYRGWCQYYAVPNNCARLQQFRAAIQVMRLRNLQRRSQRGRRLTWAKFSKLCKTLASDSDDPSPLSQREVCMSASEVRTVCGSSARTDLCGGRSERPSLPRLKKSPSPQRGCSLGFHARCNLFSHYPGLPRLIL